jgi:hypothetical protein
VRFTTRRRANGAAGPRNSGSAHERHGPRRAGRVQAAPLHRPGGSGRVEVSIVDAASASKQPQTGRYFGGDVGASQLRAGGTPAPRSSRAASLWSLGRAVVAGRAPGCFCAASHTAVPSRHVWPEPPAVALPRAPIPRPAFVMSQSREAGGPAVEIGCRVGLPLIGARGPWASRSTLCRLPLCGAPVRLLSPPGLRCDADK